MTASIQAGVTAIPFDVAIITRDGTAIGSSADDPDFTSVSQTISFSQSVNQIIIHIPIINDLDLEEEDEYFFVELELLRKSFAFISLSQVRVTIIDDDCKPFYLMCYAQIFITEHFICSCGGRISRN